MTTSCDLFPKHLFRVPVEAECITPNVFAGKSPEEIGELPLWEGNKKRTVCELFDVEGEAAEKPEDMSIGIKGDLHRVRRIGSNMTTGEIVIYSDVGTHLGEGMKGGKITVKGSADSWLGAMMKGGAIEIYGNTGDYAGAAYRGSIKGMRGGTLIIHGSAGNELGCYMRKGLIKVDGNAGQFAGIHMKNGTILILGDSEGRAGAEMTGGKIIIKGKTDEILPTFSIDSIKAKVRINEDELAGPFYVFVGDGTEQGQGKLYVAQSSNLDLKAYEKYL